MSSNKNSTWIKISVKKSSVIVLILLLVVSTNVILVQKSNVRIESISTANNYKSNSDLIGNSLPSVDIKKSFILPNETSVYRTSDSFDGYTLFVLDRFNKYGSRDHSSVLMVVDMDGNVVADKHLGNHIMGIYETAQFIDSNTVLFGSETGAKLWNFYSDQITDLSIQGHHEYEYNSNNDTIFTFNSHIIDIEGTEYFYTKIQEYTLGGVLVWELDTSTFIDPSQWCPYEDTYSDTIGSYPDITHANSIFYDAEEDIIYCNVRNVNTFYKIDHTTKEIVWGLGEWGNFSLFDKNGNPKSNLFYHPHSVEKLDDNTFILFDNDYHNQTDIFNGESRLLEITINEQTKTANVSWDWIGTSDYQSNIWSDADRLPNGNRLGTFGTYGHGGSLVYGARLTEVNEEGDVVWEYNFVNSDYYGYSVYRAERFRLSPTIKSPNDTWFLTSESVDLTWQTWYDSSIGNKINGSYELFVDEILTDSDNVTFEQFWNPANISIDLGIYPEGQYNFTLVVSDDKGHKSTEMILVNVGDYSVKRNGPEEIEIGEINTIIRWSGFTVSPLWMNLTIDDVLTRSEEWNGTTIEYDLGPLSVGMHNITLQIFNSTILLFNDSFWIQVYTTAPPEILSEPIDQSIVWNTSLMLQWDIFDNSPNYWEILANNLVVNSDYWTSKSLLLNWSLPTFDEGIYNITLKIIDRVGMIRTSTVWITISSPSPPIFASEPYNIDIYWGQTGITLVWEVHGGSNWEFLQDGMSILSGDVTSKFIDYSFNDWFSGIWLLGLYNLTLVVYDDLGEQVSSSVLINIQIQLSDPYVDEFIDSKSAYIENGENSIGAPDGVFTKIFAEYGAGYITLDMGASENILDGTGNDFQVIASSGEYTCWVGEEIDSEFVLLGLGSGNVLFDLSSVSLSSVRYVRIQYNSGGFVELDAIEAIHFNSPTEDNDSPSINSPLDFWIWDNQSFIRFTWEASDPTHFNYSIEVNEEIFMSGYWDGSDIGFTYFWETAKLHTFTLTLFDVFGNSAIDTVNVDIRDSDVNGSPIAYIAAVLGIIVLVFIQKKRGFRIKHEK